MINFGRNFEKFRESYEKLWDDFEKLKKLMKNSM